MGMAIFSIYNNVPGDPAPQRVWDEYPGTDRTFMVLYRQVVAKQRRYVSFASYLGRSFTHDRLQDPKHDEL